MNFYLTTAIAYTNGSPHMGHAYEIICADIIARYQRLNNKHVLFSTGTDNHGKKIADTAKSQNMTPMALCDKYVLEFQKLNQLLSISNDEFVRTTDDKHKIVAQLVWKQMEKDIYLSIYDGWYNVREETYVNERDALACDYMDNGTPLIKHSEPSYYFKLGQYQSQIISHIENNIDYIMPLDKREEILVRLKSFPLEDLSISRPKPNWGIDVPHTAKADLDYQDTNHVMYVWIDALTNYLTAIDYPSDAWWPADVQLIGKDIIWFHAVIWTGMLLSLQLPLPKTILAHGFVNGADHRKMSKSFNNAIDPFELLNKYDSDTIRCYLANLTNIGSDLCVTEIGIKDFHNHHLVAKFSNLVNRCLHLTKLSDHKIPEGKVLKLFSISLLKQKINNAMSRYNIKDVLNLIFEQLDSVNKFITVMAPWKKQDHYLSVLKTALEAIYILAHFLQPFMPTAISKLLCFLNQKLIPFNELTWHNLSGLIYPYDILFKQIGDTRRQKRL